MRKRIMTDNGNSKGRPLRPWVWASTLAWSLLASTALPTDTATAQQRHGGRIQKECCLVGTGGTTGVPCETVVPVGQSFECEVIVTNIDTFGQESPPPGPPFLGHTFIIDEIVDEVFHAAPAGSGCAASAAPACGGGGCPTGTVCAERRVGDPGPPGASACRCVRDFALYEGKGPDGARPPGVSPIQVRGRCVGGNDDEGLTCPLASGGQSDCTGGVCFDGVCVGGQNDITLNRTCATVADCVNSSGACVQFACLNDQTRTCQRDDCPGGTCFAGVCDANSVNAGTACSVDNCPGPGGSCALVLGRPLQGADGQQVEISHTDVVGPADETLPIIPGAPDPARADLGDRASGVGFDLGQFQEFALRFPNNVQVEPRPDFIGCRITGGGRAPDGSIDMGSFAFIDLGSFGGQVGAPCGCTGCFVPLEHVQGSWTYNRKSKPEKKGTLHAKQYNSLVCGCDGVFDGNVCSGDGPAPPRAPANMACFSGVGDFNPTSGRRTDPVAFRVEVVDRGEPGTADIYRIQIWTPGSGENAEALAAAACCTNPQPTGRMADIDDGGILISGNIQIHPQTPKDDEICPPPSVRCP
jgi:hypothetical protein